MQRRFAYMLILLPVVALAQEAAPIDNLPALPASAAPAASPEPAVPPVAPEAVQPAPAAQVEPQANAATPPSNTAPLSFGDFPYSLMMTAPQAEQLKEALTAYEHQIAAPVEEEMVVETTPQAEPEAPATYPVFTLGSVAFRTAGDWTVWINGARITPSTNTQEVRVVAISPQMVRFSWTPSYITALRERYKRDKFADTAPVAHKRTNPNTAMFDVPAGVVYFSLRPNQSFAAGYMATFEGRIASPALEKLVEPTDATAGTKEGEGAAGGNADTGETTTAPSSSNLSPQQQENIQGLGGDTIRRLYEKANGVDQGVSNESKNVQGTVDELLRSQQTISDVTPKRQ